MNAIFLKTLAVIGLICIGLLPLKIWKSHQRLREMHAPKWKYVLWVVFSFAFLGIEAFLVGDITRCLSGQHCGPSIYSGLMYGASMGLWFALYALIMIFFTKPHRVSPGPRG